MVVRQLEERHRTTTPSSTRVERPYRSDVNATGSGVAARRAWPGMPSAAYISVVRGSSRLSILLTRPLALPKQALLDRNRPLGLLLVFPAR